MFQQSKYHLQIVKNILSVIFIFVGSSIFANGDEDKKSRTLEITINPVFKNDGIVLGEKKYVTDSQDTVQIDLFRFYLSSFELTYSDGTVYIEKNSYHLIDMEFDTTLQFKMTNIPEGKIVAINFVIGVDSTKSVSGAFSGDLDPIHGMYWAWNSGYIHAKLEGKSNSCKTHQNMFEFHAGGYAFPNNAARKVELNLTEDEQSSFNKNHIVISADASYWFNGISLDKQSSIVVPGKKAMALANSYKEMFKLIVK